MSILSSFWQQQYNICPCSFSCLSGIGKRSFSGHIKIVSSTYKEIVTIPVERLIVVFLILSSQVVVFFSQLPSGITFDLIVAVDKVIDIYGNGDTSGIIKTFTSR